LTRLPSESSIGLTLTPVPQLEIPPESHAVASWSDEHGVAFATAWADGSDRWIDWPGVGRFAFGPGSTTIRVYPLRPLDEVRDLFDRVLQPVVLQALGRQALHGSAVLGTGGVLAFCGCGRSGKSTLAYALGAHGFQQIADDAVLIDSIGIGVSVRALPFVPQLREASRRHFGQAHTCASSPPHRDLPVAALRGIFILEQNPAMPWPLAERLPPVAAFAVLLPHAHCFDQRPSLQAAPLVDDYLRIVERVPVFRVSYAPSFAALDALVQSVTAVASAR
jgi:hypothetical protein